MERASGASAGCGRQRRWYTEVGAAVELEFEVFPGPEGPAAFNVRRVFDEKSALVTVLCSDAVQVRAIAWGSPNLAKVAERLRAFGEVKLSGYLVRLRAAPHELTLFDDGRAIVKGTGDVAVARALLGSWLGVRIPAAE